MSDYIDTRDGWREVDQETARESESQLAMRDGNLYRYWVREEPVPPLPTEEFTVVKVRRGPEVSQVLMRYGGEWYGVHRPDSIEGITGFEVLASPEFTTGDWEKAAENAKRVRRETAKAVLDRVREMWTGDERIWDIAREFGVERS